MEFLWFLEHAFYGNIVFMQSWTFPNNFCDSILNMNKENLNSEFVYFY